MMRRSILPILVSLSLALGLAAPRVGLTQPSSAPAGPVIEKGSTVRIEYTVTDEAGKLLETNKGGQSLQFTHGRKEMLPGVERHLLGKSAVKLPEYPEAKVTVRK